MRNRMLMGLIVVSIAICFFVTAYAQVRTFPIKVQLTREKPDKKGTDVTNIYNISIDYLHKADVTNDKYTIIYFLDDQFLADFNNQTLPFSFKRDFKGNAQREHEIRIEVEDAQENQVAVGTAKVKVKERAKTIKAGKYTTVDAE